jgi:hypothetical protein
MNALDNAIHNTMIAAMGSIEVGISFSLPMQKSQREKEPGIHLI